MVYLYVKRIKNNKYYSLRKTIRTGNKTTSKYICSLGKEISKINLKEVIKRYDLGDYSNLLKKYLEYHINIEDVEKTNIKENIFFSRIQLNEINAVLRHVESRSTKLKEISKKRIIEKFNIKFIAENISLEGNTLYFKDVKKLIDENLTSKNMSPLDISSIINNNETLNFLKTKKPPINFKLIEEIHDKIYPITRIKGYRKSELKINKNKFISSAPQKIESDLKDLIKWFNNNKNKIHPLALTIMFHHKFEKIHPFIGKNGEIGRILLNYMLKYFNYPPIIISVKYKNEYLTNMNKAHKATKDELLKIDYKSYKPLIDFMQKQFVKTYWNNFV